MSESLESTLNSPDDVEAGRYPRPKRSDRGRPWKAAPTFLFIILVILLFFAPPAQAAQRRPHQFPRLANIFLKWHLSEEEARDLARWDVIILDMEVPSNSPEAFALLRQLNPQAKILAYITAQEVRRDIATNPQTPMRRRLAARLAESWYLRSPSGELVYWWPQTWLLNISSQAPVINGQRWSDALATFVADEIASDSRWDGVYYDNLWGSVSWFTPLERTAQNSNTGTLTDQTSGASALTGFTRSQIDLNNDGREEDAPTRDRWWTEGVRALQVTTRQRVGPSFLITGNGSPIYADTVNGLLLEHFPNTNEGDWSDSMSAYRLMLDRVVKPALVVVNSNTENTGERQNWRRVRFGLLSTLLGEGYYSFDFGDQDHAQRWWYDEYDAYLGDPAGSPRTISQPVGASADSGFPPGVYRRDFKRGLVLVNATNQSQRVSFDEEFERLHGGQDPSMNDGSISSEIVLPPKDGILLLRPITALTNTPFTNGAFARVFRPDGSIARTGFFAYESVYRGGTLIERRDFNGDGQDELIVADGTWLRVIRGGDEIVKFAPFGDKFTGGFSFALGDLDQNGTWEVVVAPREGDGRVGIFNLLEGRLLRPYFLPFGRNYHSGLSVALLPQNGGRSLIAVGSGRGTVPEVVIMDSDGRIIGVPLLAFGRSFRGGVRVAGGDLDGDGKAELVVGAGPGGGPQVRIFDVGQRRLINQFFAFDPSRRNGIDVAVVDLDGDGRNEVVGLSTQAFTVLGTKVQEESSKDE
ncbi:MAG: putative glycoside hydrolase [Candidatus Uhrbacteria bacterium]